MEATIIDCTQIKTQGDLHRVFRESLSFPAWYGNNLDALYDCLTALSGTVRLLHWDIAENNLGPYGKKAGNVIAAATLHNTALDLYL